MNVVIIKYNSGNTRSVQFALERSGISAIVSDDPETITKADKVIFPGVGEASTAMNYLKERNIDRVIRNLTQPVLGICLGMQLLCYHTEENNTSCLGIFDNVMVRKFPADGVRLKVPQVGWNAVFDLRGRLFQNMTEDKFCYFVHSYYAEQNICSVASAFYHKTYCAALEKNNFYGVQFHPEKSAETGKRILDNFLSL